MTGGRPTIKTNDLKRLMFLIDQGKGRVSQDVIDRWERELVGECARIARERG